MFFFVGEGAAYGIAEYGGGILAKIVGESVAETSSRAFFSGIGSEASAIEKGFTTLGKTDAGINLAKMTEDMDYYGPMNGQLASQAWQ